MKGDKMKKEFLKLLLCLAAIVPINIAGIKLNEIINRDFVIWPYFLLMVAFIALGFLLGMMFCKPVKKNIGFNILGYVLLFLGMTLNTLIISYLPNPIMQVLFPISRYTYIPVWSAILMGVWISLDVKKE